jgi:hypothetical protein
MSVADGAPTARSVTGQGAKKCATWGTVTSVITHAAGDLVDAVTGLMISQLLLATIVFVDGIKVRKRLDRLERRERDAQGRFRK